MSRLFLCFYCRSHASLTFFVDLLCYTSYDFNESMRAAATTAKSLNILLSAKSSATWLWASLALSMVTMLRKTVRATRYPPAFTFAITKVPPSTWNKAWRYTTRVSTSTLSGPLYSIKNKLLSPLFFSYSVTSHAWSCWYALSWISNVEGSTISFAPLASIRSPSATLPRKCYSLAMLLSLSLVFALKIFKI